MVKVRFDCDGGGGDVRRATRMKTGRLALCLGRVGSEVK
jgi:hypothetical protein